MPAPTGYELSAAIQVARFIDAGGNPQEDARTAYVFTTTQATFAPSALRAGEALLIAAGLLRLLDGRLMPTAGLANIATIDDAAEAAASLNALLVEQAQNDERAETGLLGEQFVLGVLRENLTALGRNDLAERCEQVSLISDRFGYDLTAPTLDHRVRRLEVKTQTVDGPPSTVRFYLTRHEYDVGRANPTEWALVACANVRGGGPLLIGWCRASTLVTYLPADQGGRWTEAFVRLPASVLTTGFPSAV